MSDLLVQILVVLGGGFAVSAGVTSFLAASSSALRKDLEDDPYLAIEIEHLVGDFGETREPSPYNTVPLITDLLLCLHPADLEWFARWSRLLDQDPGPVVEAYWASVDRLAPKPAVKPKAKPTTIEITKPPHVVYVPSPRDEIEIETFGRKDIEIVEQFYTGWADEKFVPPPKLDTSYAIVSAADYAAARRALMDDEPAKDLRDYLCDPADLDRMAQPHRRNYGGKTPPVPINYDTTD